MVDNFYFLFLDEIYTSNLNDMLKFTKADIFKRPNHLHFGIAGVIVAATNLKDIMASAERIKKRYFPVQQDIIFHYADILNCKDAFSSLGLDSNLKTRFNSSISSFVQNSDFKFHCVFVDKHEIIKKYGIFDKNGKVTKVRKIGSNLFPKSKVLDYNLYLLCLKKIIEHFYIFLASKKITARGIIVAEARGEREDTELRSAFKKIYYYGIASIKPTELRRIILDLLIVPKKQNYIGTQLADLVLYSSYDGGVPNHNIRNDHFINYDSVLKRKLLNKKVAVIP